MRIHDYKQAPNPRRVRIFLAEKGLDIDYVQVDLMTKQNMTPDFLGKNSMAALPVLELDDGTCIAESVAICRYFEELHPEPALFGSTAKEKAEVEMWQRRMEFDLLFPVSQAFRHGFPGFADRVEQLPAWQEQNQRRSVSQFQWLNDLLADREFVAGRTYTIADITALCAVDFAKIIKLRPGDEHPHLKRWHAAVSARPSAAA